MIDLSILASVLFFAVGIGWYGSTSGLSIVDSTPTSIANSVAATVLASLTLPANSIGPNGMLEIFVWTRWTNNSAGAAQNPRINVSIGGQQIGGVNTVTLALAPTPNTHGLYCHIFVKNLNAVNVQNSLNWNCLTDPARQGSDRFPDAIDGGAQFNATIDTTIDNLLTVTAQNAVADPAYTTFYDGLQVKGS